MQIGGFFLIEVEKLKRADIPTIIVEASNKLFKELGNNTYDFVDLISELIDNSIAARIDDELLKVQIEIAISNELYKSHLLIRDNAAGIPRKDLGRAISPGGFAGGSTLNEHGLGMKQSIAALGDFKYLATKTQDEEKAIIVDKLRFGDIFPKLIHVDWDHGTEICIDKLEPIVPTGSQSYSRKIKAYLGARYRRYLKVDNPMMKLSIKVFDMDDIDKDGNAALIKTIRIEENKPIYFHPNKRRNMPVVPKKVFKDKGWEAELTFGYAPKDDEYDEMGLSPPKKYEPYHVSLQKQGFDIIKEDRVIMFHQLSSINIVPTKHNKYNLVKGEIDLKMGFVTAITKNNIIFDSNFQNLIIQIKDFIKEGKYLEKKTYPDELPESLLRDRLAIHLKNRSIDPKNNVQTEYAIEGLGGFIDIYADEEAWELKKAPASGLDVYQLFAYMDMGNIENGFLIAPSFKTGAEAARNFIKDRHKKQIIFAPTTEFPITDSPSREEMKRYY